MDGEGAALAVVGGNLTAAVQVANGASVSVGDSGTLTGDVIVTDGLLTLENSTLSGKIMITEKLVGGAVWVLWMVVAMLPMLPVRSPPSIVPTAVRRFALLPAP